MRKQTNNQTSYQELLEGSLTRSDPFDSIVSGHLGSRGGGIAVIVMGLLLAGALVIPLLLSLLDLF